MSSALSIAITETQVRSDNSFYRAIIKDLFKFVLPI